jgi:hypothetical protein
MKNKAITNMRIRGWFILSFLWSIFFNLTSLYTWAGFLGFITIMPYTAYLMYSYNEIEERYKDSVYSINTHFVKDVILNFSILLITINLHIFTDFKYFFFYIVIYLFTSFSLRVAVKETYKSKNILWILLCYTPLLNFLFSILLIAIKKPLNSQKNSKGSVRG